MTAAVDALGPASVILAPSNGHNLWLRAWHDAYPDANVHVSAGIPKKLPALGGYLLLDEASDPPWSADLEQQMLRGVPFFDECVFLHKASRSLIVTDLVQNHRRPCDEAEQIRSYIEQQRNLHNRLLPGGCGSAVGGSAVSGIAPARATGCCARG